MRNIASTDWCLKSQNCNGNNEEETVELGFEAGTNDCAATASFTAAIIHSYVSYIEHLTIFPPQPHLTIKQQQCNPSQ